MRKEYLARFVVNIDLRLLNSVPFTRASGDSPSVIRAKDTYYMHRFATRAATRGGRGQGAGGGGEGCVDRAWSELGTRLFSNPEFSRSDDLPGTLPDVSARRQRASEREKDNAQS